MDHTLFAGTPLFQGMNLKEIHAVLDCLGAKEKHFSKGDVIYLAGDTAKALGLVIRGCVQIESDDVWGNKSILDHVGAGAVFAETYACLPHEPLMVSVTAAENSDILFLDALRLLTVCPATCEHHSRLIRNLLTISVQKNLNLSRKIFHTSSKTIRGRLLSYLSFQAAQQKSCRFRIPFSRQQLADYLGVDRSALSNELGKMQKEGLLTTNKYDFCLNSSFLSKPV